MKSKLKTWLLRLRRVLGRVKVAIAPKTPSNQAKIALIVGHTARTKGAINYLGECEYEFNKRIAKKTRAILLEKFKNIRVEIFYRDGIGLDGCAKQVGEWGACVSLELHFNSFKKKAFGCEILVDTRHKFYEETHKIADRITDSLSGIFGIKERNGEGVKELSSGRGYLNLKLMRLNGVKHPMLIEPCFANKKTVESIAIFENEDRYATFLATELGRVFQ